MRAVYPRRCGEHSHGKKALPDQRGLSPQVRGTQRLPAALGHFRRFIPAGAGNTMCPASVSPCIAVYPRRCGEHR